MINFKQFNNHAANVRNTINTLKQYGINLRIDGSVTFDFESNLELINRLPNQGPFTWGFVDDITLQLAIYQEIFNDRINEYDLWRVNMFFGLNITADDINEKSKYL